MSKVLFAIILCFAVTLQSCAFIESIFSSSCTRNVTDKYVFRASSEVSSSSPQLSQEKALADAQRNIMEQVDAYIVDSFSYKNFLRDDKFEEKIDLMRNKVLELAEVSCSRASHRAGVYKYSTTLQINKSVVDQIISEYK